MRPLPFVNIGSSDDVLSKYFFQLLPNFNYDAKGKTT